MIRFNWKKIEYSAKHDIRKINRIFYWLTYGTIPEVKHSWVYGISEKDYAGMSFLVHPDRLFQSRQQYYSDQQIVEYLYIASLRNFAHYSITGDTSLAVEHCPLPIGRIYVNSLFDITNDKIKLKLEN